MPGEVVTSAPEVAAVKQALKNGSKGIDIKPLHGEMQRHSRIAGAGFQSVVDSVKELTHHIKAQSGGSLRDKYMPARAR